MLFIFLCIVLSSLRIKKMSTLQTSSSLEMSRHCYILICFGLKKHFICYYLLFHDHHVNILLCEHFLEYIFFIFNVSINFVRESYYPKWILSWNGLFWSEYKLYFEGWIDSILWENYWQADKNVLSWEDSWNNASLMAGKIVWIY